jgi:tetratricopeptide (TPR) repeat protein
MKVAHRKTGDPPSLEEAMELEKSGDLPAAEKMYREIIRQHPKNEAAHNRLIILYRKLKDPHKELKALDEAISIFEKRDINPAWAENKTISKLSRSIAKSTGLVDKKGKHIYLGQPLEKWTKRRETVKRKIS